MRQSYIDANNPLIYGEGGYRDQLQSFVGTNAELAKIRDNVRESLADGEITLAQYRELLAIYERLASAGPINLVGSPNGAKGSGSAGQSVALLPGATDPITGRPLDGGATPTVTVDANPFAEAGETFLAGLEGVFANAASELGAAIASGDFSDFNLGSFAGGLAGLGGSFLGNLLLPGLGSMILGPLLGGLFGGLLGGGEDDARSRAAQDAERRGGASSLEFNIFFTMTNHIESKNGEADLPKLERIGRQYIEDSLKQVDLRRFAIKPTG